MGGLGEYSALARAVFDIVSITHHSATECPRIGHVLNLSAVHIYKQMVDQNYIQQQGGNFRGAFVPLNHDQLFPSRRNATSD